MTVHRTGPRLAWVILALSMVAGCGGTQDGIIPLPPDTTEAHGSTTTTTNGQDTDPMAAKAIADLARRLNVEPASVVVEVHEAVTWSDGSLGCPQPGMFYTQALVPGSRAVLRHEVNRYVYHAGPDGEPFLCETADPDHPDGTVPNGIVDR